MPSKPRATSLDIDPFRESLPPPLVVFCDAMELWKMKGNNSRNRHETKVRFGAMSPHLTNRKRLWLLTKEHLGPSKMGPAIRLFGQAHAAINAGYSVVILCPSLAGPPLPGIEVGLGIEPLLEGWKPGDRVVVDPYIPGRWLFRLLASPIPFDADFYCVSLPETSEVFPVRSRSWLRKERIRRSLKYAWISCSARRMYFSNENQILSMLGMIATGPDAEAPVHVGRLVQRCIVLPMGVRAHAPEPIATSPYPPGIAHRPIALWGGGIWPWFDMDTLLAAFASYADRSESPVLFFLSGSNHRREKESDSPIQLVRKKAESMGILGANVFFNETSVDPGSLGPWLQHATLGVMANPNSWEAMVSWRTRYLDLLAYGVPLVVAGSDSLGNSMVDAGAALFSPSGDPLAFAQNIRLISDQPTLRRKISHRVGEFASAMAQTGIDAKWLESLDSDDWIPRSPSPIGWTNLLRFKYGR